MKFPSWPPQKGYRDIDLGLTRVYELLARLDNPHLKIPPTIHIAGTNGKGSTLSFLRGIFAEAGLSVHTYTSPHLVNFNERIVLNGAEISDYFLEEILLECKQAAEKTPEIPVTFFEGITVAAFLAFSRASADVLLLETGMGGRLDATNVLPEVLCSIITPIAIDHTDFLGKTLEKIAFEKAGIIKKGCTTLSGKQKTKALQTIERQALTQLNDFKVFGRDWKISKRKNGFIFNGFNREFLLPFPSLKGDHQIENASLAIATVFTQQKFLISEEQIKLALTKITWPARLQKITAGKYFKHLPKNSELYLDGSHNLQGSGTILKFLQIQKNKKKFVIFSMLQDKDCFGFLKKISAEIDKLIAIEIPHEPKSRKAEEIKEIAEEIGINAKTAGGLKEAFGLCKTDEDAVILVCGSLYLAGSFLDENE